MFDDEAPLSLRIIADMLVDYRLPQRRDKNGFDYLLGLLKTAQIQAVAYFPAVTDQPIPVSQRYWKGVSRDALDSLLRKKSLGSVGTYPIRLKEIAGEAFRVATHGTDISDTEKEQIVVRFIQLASRKSTVEVLKSEWQKFMASRKLFDVDPLSRVEGAAPVGRPKNEHWEEVLAELAVILWRELGKTGVQQPTQDAIAAEIRSNLKGTVGLPMESTIRDRIATIRSRMKNRISENSNKTNKTI